MGCCGKCWDAPAGDPWGPSGLDSPCGDDAAYIQDGFDTLALSSRNFTITAPVTVGNGFLYVPDASFAHAQRSSNFLVMASGAGDFVWEMDLNFLIDGNPQNGTYGLFLFLSGIAGGIVKTINTSYLNDGTPRLQLDWAVPEILTLVPGVSTTYVLRVERVSGTVNISRDGVVKESFAGGVNNYGLTLCTNTTKGSTGVGPLCRQRWGSFKMARC